MRRDQNGQYYFKFGLSNFQTGDIQGGVQDTEGKQATGATSRREEGENNGIVTPFFEQLSFDSAIGGRCGHISINVDSKLRAGVSDIGKQK
jgi:hypothetical protein